MSELTLVIGNKNYSSWSLRPWLVLTQTGIPFREEVLFLDTPAGDEALAVASPSGRVPVLRDGGLVVWESLAICEYLAERYPHKGLWPADPAARAVARAVASEMHAGFAALREHMTMNVRRRFPGRGRTPKVSRDISRIQNLWRDCQTRFGKKGSFLFGDFSIADAMYAPVCLRFVTYAVDLEADSAAYVAKVSSLPAMRKWIDAAAVEPAVIRQYELDG